jgi:3-oxoacyl-[acyl-carrier protein] reductase
MSDFLLELSKNPTARKAIKRVGLPIPMPQPLRRATGPWVERPLEDDAVAFGAAPGGTLGETVAGAVVRAGACPHLVGDAAAVEAFTALGEAFGRAPARLDPSAPAAEARRMRALVFDASGVDGSEGLGALHGFFNPLLGRLERNGRVVVLGRPPHDRSAARAAAAQAGLEGFVRSLSKEIGRQGSTANLVVVADGAEARAEGPLRFLLSTRSAFVTGQPFWVTDVAQAAVEVAPTRWERPLEHKVALVTGAARGIGAATARRLAEEGAEVLCLDLPSDDAPVARLAREVRGGVLLANVTDADTPARVAAELRSRGGVDVVVHNAGVTRDKTLAKMSAEAWDQAVDINLGAVTRITDALLDGVLKDGGRVVCLSSVTGIAGNVGQTNYSASKAGLVGYVEHLSAELADRGVTVNAVAPGFIETRLTAHIPPVIREVGRRLSSLGQGGLPEDVAEVIAFLASPGAIGLTGETIRVCGGALIGA